MPYGSKQDRDILQLFQELKKQGETAAQPFRDVATINERYSLGDQWGSVVQSNGTSDTSLYDWSTGDDEDAALPMIHVNKCMGIRQTWCSLMLKSRISAAAYPATDEPLDHYRAQTAKKVIKWYSAEEKTADKTASWVTMVCEDGAAGMKVYFDARDRRVHWAPVSIHDYLVDDVEDTAQAQWCIFRRYISEDEARELIRARRPPPPEGEPEEDIDVAASPYFTTSGLKKSGVEIWELWHRPSRKYERGLMASFVNGEIVEAIDYPFAFNVDGREEFLLPLVIIKMRTVRGSAYGATSYTNVCQIQRLVNEGNARIEDVQRRTGGVKTFVPNSMLKDFEDGEHQTKGFAPGEEVDQARYLMPPDIPPGWERRVEYYEDRMPEVMGLSPVVNGDEARSISGVAIDSLFALDASRNSDAARSLEAGVLTVWKLTLKEIGLCYDTAEKVRISGDTVGEVLQFSGADIEGVDVRLEVGSEVDQMDSVQQQQARAGLKDGTTTPADVLEADKDPNLSVGRQVVQQLIDDFLAGEVIDPKPGLDFTLDVFDAGVTKAMATAMAEGRRDDWGMLHELQKIVADLAQEAQGAAPQQPAPDDANMRAPPPAPPQQQQPMMQ